MEIEDFMNKAIKQNRKNVFRKCNLKELAVPEELKTFYRECNPTNVLVTMKGKTVKFYPLDELVYLQSDYNLGKECFVFATCNDNPIYIMNHWIFTCHKDTSSKDNIFVAENFEEFLTLID